MENAQIKSDHLSTTWTPTRRGTISSGITRLFSFSSEANTVPTYCRSVSQTKKWAPVEPRFNLDTKEFFIKILQLLITVICAGMYSDGLKIFRYRQNVLALVMYPNVVFSAFIVITSVIAMSYILGRIMPDVLMRIFNCLGCLMYFISACVTLYVWYTVARPIAEHCGGLPDTRGGSRRHPVCPKTMTAQNRQQILEEVKYLTYMLLGDTALSYLNSAVYALDVWWNLKTFIKDAPVDV